MCNSEFRGFQQQLSEFDKRGIRIVGISVDTPEDSRRMAQKLGLTFPLLSDAKSEVIRKYDLLHTGGGPKASDISRPAEFLIDAAGTVLWVNLTGSAVVRAQPAQVLKVWDSAKH
jgi:mycoredoxin-dependent peroxiredoxin